MPAAKRRTQKRRSVPRRKPATAIVRVQPVVEKPWELGPDQIAIIKNSICKGATDDELKFCLVVAQRYKLDPFKRQIWFVPRWDKNAENGKGGKGATVYVPQVGIDGLLMCAARDHRSDYGSVSLPMFGPMQEVEWTDEGKTRKFKAPDSALVKVWKKGVTEPTEAQAYWDEYAPYDLAKAPFWRKMPRRMLAKCATALAIRQAYPDLGGVYIPEECERINEDYTESGREIVVQHGGSQAAADEVAKRRVEELQAKIDARKQESTEPYGGVELDWSIDEASPVIRGDLEALLESLMRDLHFSRGKDDQWHCEPRDAENLKAICKRERYELKEILPVKFPAVAASNPAPAGTAPPPGKSPTGETPHKPTSPAGGSKPNQPKEASKPTVASDSQPSGASSKREDRGIATPVSQPPRALIPVQVTAVNWTPSGKGLDVIINGKTHFYCFDNRKMGEDGDKLFDVLVREAKGQECVFVTEKSQTKDKREFIKIKAALRIGELEWEEDGMPILRRDPPAQGFYQPPVEREPGDEEEIPF